MQSQHGDGVQGQNDQLSNAEEKSSKASTDMLPLLRERNRSLTTFRRAVSVLRPGRYAD